MRKLVFLASFAGLSLADPASARLITFDDLVVPANSPYAHIQNPGSARNPYAGFDWSPNFFYLDGADNPYPYGYRNGVVSPANVAFNRNGRQVSFSSRGPFELDSFYLAAAWRDGLQVRVTGELNGVVVDSTTLTVSTSGPTLETFNWDVNKVVFDSVKKSGVQVGFPGSQFVLDNISVSPVANSSIRFNAFAAVPEPSTWTLMLIGFASLGFAAYNRPTSVRSPRVIRLRSGFAQRKRPRAVAEWARGERRVSGGER